jgi:hypothetical protein
MIANDDVYFLLNQGLTFWNKLRVEHNYAHLSMPQINLSGWNLIGYDLRFIDFSNANLSRAQLTGANLTGCNFTCADLSHAHLREAFLVGTNFQYTNLTGTHFNMTRFLNTCIHDCLGLDECDHQGTSMMDQGTLINSHNIPNNFLYGVGLVDWEIEAAKLKNMSLTSQELNNVLKHIYEHHSTNPDKYYKCFISYSREEKKFADFLYRKLRDWGIQCWMDQHSILPGNDIRDEISQGINSRDKVILCCSKASLNSYWVNIEIDKALAKEENLWKEYGKRELALISLNLDDYVFKWNSSRANELTRRHIEDVTNWRRSPKKIDHAIQRLEKSLSINNRFDNL